MSSSRQPPVVRNVTLSRLLGRISHRKMLVKTGLTVSGVKVLGRHDGGEGKDSCGSLFLESVCFVAMQVMNITLK